MSCSDHTPVAKPVGPATITRLRHIAAIYDPEMSTVLPVSTIKSIVECLDVLEWIARNPGAHPANINREAIRVLEKL